MGELERWLGVTGPCPNKEDQHENEGARSISEVQSHFQDDANGGGFTYD